MLLGVAPASALTLGFVATDGNAQPTTAVGTMHLDLSLADLIASDSGGFLIPLGVAVTAQVTLTDSSGADSLTYTLAPRFSTSAQELLLQVELLAGNPALVQLVLSDSAGWRGCLPDPATCERRVLSVTVPGGFGPGVAVGPTFDSDWGDSGYQVDFSIPEPGTGLLLALGALALAARRRHPRPVPADAGRPAALS
jgi:hypothetical protein